MKLIENMTQFIDFHKDESIIVCGLGKSLLNLKNPEKYITIGVNDIDRIFTPDYLLICDEFPSWHDQFRVPYAEATKAKYIFSQHDLPFKNLIKFKLGEYQKLDLSDRETIDYSLTSVYMACILAHHMGAKKIGIIGLDFTKDHAFGETGFHPLTENIGTLNRHFWNLFGKLAEKGVSLYNLSEFSEIKIPYLPLEKF